MLRHASALKGALIAATVLVPASALARPMTPEDVAKLESVGQVAVSPDGSGVALTTASLPDITDGEDNGFTTQQLKMAYGPQNLRDFLPDDMNVSGIEFSPDGRMVSFLWAKDDEDRAVWGIPVDGGAQRKLAAVKDAGVRSYVWAPDGSHMHLLVGAEKDTAREDESDAGFNAIVYEEEARLNRLFRANIGMEVDAEPQALTLPGYVSAFEIAPDARTAIIQTAPTPNVDDSYTAKRVNIVDLTSGDVRAVVATPGKLGDVEISPDGRQLAMIAGIDVNDPAATTLHFVDTSTGKFTVHNANAPEAVIDTEYMADGRILAVVHIGAQSVLRIHNPDGSLVREVDPGALILRSVTVGGDKVLVTADSPTHPRELYALDGNRFVRWTQHNSWLADIDMGKQRTFTYTARDGQQVEGVLVEPVGGIPAGGAPLILDVHGGPEAHDSNGWTTNYSGPGQVAAGQGYAVFQPNYRGSTAYGTPFSKQHQNDYAGKEFNDLVDGKRALVSAGIADADRTGITGGSYGGYATAWASTALSEEFAAGVMFVGISNQISKFGTTDIPKEMFNVHSRKWPWEDWQGMLEVSPIYHVEKAETPLLIMHGAEDTRVAPSQSYELYRNIKVRKPETPVRLVLYPGEGHGNARAASRYDYNLRMMRWFDTYLKPGNRDAELPDARPMLAEGVTGAKSKDDDES
ncbi:Dipeptidyl-peptidase IV [Alteripontixanthobacter maritimus]|uniref:Dipeptidyl-peptidase IV n=1 Tax=Alteripontixanthobacter maritimus TaxID=2161824 RepID=A0A369QAY7_9SPHN|nr:S9 family peptidase [Alteripontixanthobacter maritimus]RDC60705.1 Dipeptidyl-peptidase IV [Alteripontixanthobacter maritimus]